MLRPNLIYPLGWKGHLHSRVNEIPKYNNVDVLVLGSSHAYRGFDPRIFEKYDLTMFNLGSSGQSPAAGHVLLQRYLDDLSPKIILYVLPPGSFYSKGIESSLDVIANDQNDSHTAKLALRVNHLKTYNTFIYGSMRNLFRLDKNFVEPINRESEKYIAGGYVEKHDRNNILDEQTEITWKLNEMQMEAFEENLKLFKERNIPFIILQTPVTENIYQAYENPEKYDELMNSYGEYHNFNGEIDLNDTLHFYDSHHMNSTGVEIFNRYFLDEMDLENRIR